MGAQRVAGIKKVTGSPVWSASWHCSSGQKCAALALANLQPYLAWCLLLTKTGSVASPDHGIAVCSHKDLVQQLEHASDDIQSSNDRLRQVEADRVAGQWELDQLRQQLAAASTDKETLSKTIHQL